MLQGYTPVPLEHFGGLVTNWPPEMLSCELFVEATNVRYTQAGVSLREGLALAMQTPSQAAVRGLLDYAQLDGTEQPVVFDDSGHLYVESPAGSGNLVIADAAATVALPAAAWMNGASAFNRAYMAFGDSLTGTAAPASFDGAHLDPVTPPAPTANPAYGDAGTAGDIAGGTRYAVVMYKTRAGSLTGPSAPVAVNLSGKLPSPNANMWLVSSTSTMPQETIYACISFSNALGEALPGPTASVSVPVADGYGVAIAPSIAPPPGTTFINYYAGTAAGSLTLQASTVPGTTGLYMYSPPTTSGRVPPTVDSSGHRLALTGIPTGPTSTAARVVALTVAGASNAGPYFYIEEGQTVDGVVETATVIDDNTTTTATFNFDDNFLAASLDASDQFRSIVLPDVQGVLFSQTTQRLMWWGDPAQPATVYCSQPGDAGTYLGDTGFFQVAEGSGLKVTACFEFRNQLYVALERGIYLVTPNDGDPATWSITHVTHSIGAVGPRAVAVGSDFVFLVHQSGAYLFSGGTPTWISEELLGPSHLSPGVWEQINWSQAPAIWASIDHDEKCVRVGCPTGASAVCDTIYKVSYLDGWEPSQRFSAFTARYHYFPGRRWTVDTIGAVQCVSVRRPQALPPFPADRRQATSQILLASAQPPGAIYAVDPSRADDGGRPFAWALTSGAFSFAERMQRERQGIEMMGVVQIRCSGSGTLKVETVTDGGDPKSIGLITLAPGTSRSVQVIALAMGEAVSLRLSGGYDQQRSRIQLQGIYAYMKPVWSIWPTAGAAMGRSQGGPAPIGG